MQYILDNEGYAELNLLLPLIQFYKIQISSMNTSVQIVPTQDASIQTEELLTVSPQTKDQAKSIDNHQLSLYLNQKCYKNTKKNTYNWNRTESSKYVKFLKKHASLFSLSFQERKSLKINLMMSEMIQTRTASQCRSHHQKMLAKFESVANIIDAYECLRPQKKQKSKSSNAQQEISKQNQSQRQSILKQDEISSISAGKTPPFWMRYANLYDSSQASFGAFDFSQS